MATARERKVRDIVIACAIAGGCPLQLAAIAFGLSDGRVGQIVLAMRDAHDHAEPASLRDVDHRLGRRQGRHRRHRKPVAVL